MLGLRPLGGAALASVTLPEPVANAFDAITTGRGVEFAVILEIQGFPKQYAPASGGVTPLLGAPLLAKIGLPGEGISDPVSIQTLLLSDYPYRTKPDDLVRPNIWTEARMTRRADIEQSAPVSQGASRRAQDTTGDLEFADNDGFLRGISHTYSFEGRPATIRIVEIGQPWISSTVVSQAVVKRLTRARGSVRVNLEDAANIIDTPLVPRVYGGTGLRDGSSDLKGTSPPIGYGLCKYAKPLLEDPSIYLFRLSDYSINAVHLVEERGLPFTFDADYASYELLRVAAGSLAEGEYATSLVDGSIVIKFAGGAPVDPDAIRVTFEGDKSGGTYVSFMGDVMLSMLRYSMGTPETQIDGASYNELPQHAISYYFGGGTTSPTGAQAFKEIMESAYGTFGSVNNEKVGVKLFYPPGDQSAAQSFVEDEIFGVEEVEPPQEAVYSQTIGWGPNQNPYDRDELAVGSLTETQIEERTRSFEGVHENANPNIKASNLNAVQGTEIQSVYEAEEGAADSVARLMGVWGVDTKTYEVSISFAAANVTRGSVISMTHRDFDDKSGGKFLVFNKRLQFSKRRVLLTVVG